MKRVFLAVTIKCISRRMNTPGTTTPQRARSDIFYYLFTLFCVQPTTRRLLAPLLALSVSVVVRGVRLDALIACTRLGCARSRQDKQSSAPCETQPLCREPLCGVFVISHRTLAPRAMRDWIVIAASTAPPLTVCDRRCAKGLLRRVTLYIVCVHPPLSKGCCCQRFCFVISSLRFKQ